MKSIKIRDAIENKKVDNKEDIINLFESYLDEIIPVGYSEKEVIDFINYGNTIKKVSIEGLKQSNDFKAFFFFRFPENATLKEISEYAEELIGENYEKS